MKRYRLTRKPTFLEILFFFIILALITYNSWGYINTFYQTKEKARDALRLSDTDQIQAALLQYYTTHNNTYPPCLYKTNGCPSLEGTKEMTIVPKDPESGLGYSYVTFGKGSVCTGYHLGISLERKASQALLTGSDAPPEPSSKLCSGSAPDFSGLSFVKGGQPCNLIAGTPQPTDAANGETCYDIARHRPQ